MATDKSKPAVDNVPDSDDDLDDLDDVLSQFTPASKPNPPQSPLTSPPPPPPTATTTSFHRPRNNTRVGAPPISVPGSGTGLSLDATAEADEDELSAEFSRELMKGMESLMQEITAGTSAGEGREDEQTGNEALKAAWEKMLVDGMNGMGDNDLTGLEQFLGQEQSQSGQNETAASGSSDFQNKIKQTMNKLRESDSDLKQPDGSNPLHGANPDSLEALLASLGDLGLDGNGIPENEEELAGMLENMMTQLVSKDVLYDPLKELAESFPPYLEKPPSPIAPADRTRYESQLACVHKILAVFDNPKYSDKDQAMMKNVSDLMNEMQSYGSPPEEVMGPLPPGMGLGPDGMPQMGPDGCVVG